MVSQAPAADVDRDVLQALRLSGGEAERRPGDAHVVGGGRPEELAVLHTHALRRGAEFDFDARVARDELELHRFVRRDALRALDINGQERLVGQLQSRQRDDDDAIHLADEQCLLIRIRQYGGPIHTVVAAEHETIRQHEARLARHFRDVLRLPRAIPLFRGLGLRRHGQAKLGDLLKGVG
jgi:hypothetical protein